MTVHWAGLPLPSGAVPPPSMTPGTARCPGRPCDWLCCGRVVSGTFDGDAASPLRLAMFGPKGPSRIVVDLDPVGRLLVTTCLRRRFPCDGRSSSRFTKAWPRPPVRIVRSTCVCGGAAQRSEPPGPKGRSVRQEVAADQGVLNFGRRYPITVSTSPVRSMRLSAPPRGRRRPVPGTQHSVG